MCAFSYAAQEPAAAIFSTYLRAAWHRASCKFIHGARVECRMDDVKYYKGTVLRHHYSEDDWERGVFAPYQVELDDGSLIYVIKDDGRIRAAGTDSSDEPVAAPNTPDGDA